MRAAAVIAWVVCFLLAGCGRSPAVSGNFPVPNCRLDQPQAAVVQLAANEALRRVKRVHTLDAERVALNPKQRSDKELALYLVRDAHRDQVDAQGCIKSPGGVAGSELDPLSIRGICRATDSRIFCSSGAVSAILGSRGEGAPFLLFLLAHEINHVALGHPGALIGGNSFAVDLATPRARRLADLSAACLKDEEQLARETAADQGALEVISSAFTEGPLARYPDDPSLSLIEGSEQVYQSFRRLLVWEAEYYGATSGLVAPGGNSACEVLSDGTGTIELPELGGDHPHSWQRLGKLVMWTAKRVTAVANKSASDRAQGAIASWYMNALTDGATACAKDVAVRRFCEDVRRLAAGELDCANAPPGGPVIQINDDDLASCGLGNDDANDASIPIPEIAPATYREPDSNPAALLLKFHVLSLDNPTREDAVAVGKRAAANIGTFLRGLSATLRERGGYVLVHESEPVSISYNKFSGAFTATSEHRLIARVPESFRIDQVAGYGAIQAFGRGTEAKVVPWKEARYTGILHYNSDPTDSRHDSKRILTEPLPLDFYYDLSKARAGSQAQIAPDFAKLICYTRERLRTRWPAAWTFEQDSESWAFYLSAEHENWYFPQAWGAVATSGCPVAPVLDRKLRAALSRGYDYGNQSQEIPKQIFDELFGAT